MESDVLRFRLLELLLVHEATGTSALLSDRAMDEELHVGLLDAEQQLDILKSRGPTRREIGF